MTTTALDLLVSEWRASGFNTGDIVLLHSNLKGLLRRYKKRGFDLSLDIVLQSLLGTVGTTGTMIFPLFNFDFTQGVPFDIRSTPSHMGALSEAARLHPYAVRTGHPIYSFAAIGFHAARFKGLVNFSGYGADSPFAVLRELDAKIAVINLPDQNSMTFYHHVEEMLDVTYRYHKNFHGTYVDQQGYATQREFGLFVRDVERGVVTDVNLMGELLWDRGLYHGTRHGDGFGCRTIASRDLYDATADIICSGKAEGLLYSIQEKT